MDGATSQRVLASAVRFLGELAEKNATYVDAARDAHCQELDVNEKYDGMDDKIFSVVFAMVVNLCQLAAAVTVLLLLVRTKRGQKALVPLKTDQRMTGMPTEWFREAYAIKIEEGISIDGVVLIRLCLLGLKFSVFGTIMACFLIPLYVYGGGGDDGIMTLSISNLRELGIFIDRPPKRFWGVIVVAWLTTGNFIWLMRAEWRHFIALRHRHFTNRANGKMGASARQAQYSLMIERVAPDQRNLEEMTDVLSKLFPDGVRYVWLQPDTIGLYHLKSLKEAGDTICVFRCCQHRMHEQMSHLVKLERRIALRARRAESLLQDVATDGQVANIVNVMGVNRWGGGTSAVTAQPVPQAVEQDPELTSTGTSFVTLSYVRDRVVAEQAVLFDGENKDLSGMIVSPAPEARDLVWENVCVPHDSIRKRIWLGNAICFMGMLLWSVPVSGIQVIASVKTLEHVPGLVPWLHEHIPTLFGLMVSYFPVLALLVLLTLLPYVLRFVGLRVESRKTNTDIVYSILWRNFAFQLITLWLTVFSSSLLDSVGAIWEHPNCMYYILGASIPKVSVYFIQFVVARTGISLPLLLLRVSSLFKLLTSPDEAEPVYCYFDTQITNVCIVFVLGLMYSVVAPIIMPVCIVYFGLASVVFKWLFVHVYSSEFDLEGRAWFVAFRGLIVGSLFGNIALCGLAVVNCGANTPQFYATGVLPFVIMFFARDCENRYRRAASVMSYQNAVQVDEDMKDMDRIESNGTTPVITGPSSLQFRRDFYADPIIKEAAHLTSDESDSGGDSDASSDAN
eukprot:TRINITY_DN26835_c0_g1_i1.p1 TRINITY_DN26835_c0_g1~~TRINITY_DN26835_c0_g1_i1.p1  ORF type:complete len:814 (+),score=94.06 TRINITY_DN26835_c0_g1_i1:68-2443(+)